jgi:hypothetical protein
MVRAAKGLQLLLCCRSASTVAVAGMQPTCPPEHWEKVATALKLTAEQVQSMLPVTSIAAVQFVDV